MKNNKKYIKKYFAELKSSFKYRYVFVYIFIALIILFTFLNISNINFCCIPFGWKLIGTFAIAVALVFFMIYIRIWKQFTSVSVNFLDWLLILIILSLLSSLILLCILGIFNWIFLHLSIIVVFIVLWIFRIILSIRYNKNKKVYLSNNISRAYYGNLKKYKNQPLILEDKPSKKDLLYRKNKEDLFMKILKHNKLNDACVIAINGKWGSGKTTLINRTLANFKDKNFKIINETTFNPWMCNSREDILMNMCKVLFDSLSYKYGYYQNKHLIKSIARSLQGQKILSGFSLWFDYIGGDIDIQLLHKQVDNLLIQSKKKLVFVLDNLDRLEPDQILFILKAIRSVFNCKDIFFIIAYDEEILDRYLDDKCFETFKEKIINVEIILPSLRTCTKVDLFNTCLKNIYKYYEVPDEDIIRFNEINSLIINKIEDVRKFILFVNSVLPETFMFNTHKLDRRDLFVLNTIKYFDKDLYLDISDNRGYFVSEHLDTRIYYASSDVPMFTDSFNKKAKELYENILKGKGEYYNVLKMVFPSIGNWLDKQPIRDANRLRNSSKLKQIIEYKSACSAKFFDSYFEDVENSYIDINKVIHNIIELSKSGNSEKIKKVLLETLINGPEYVQVNLLIDLDDCIEELSEIGKIDICNLIIDNYESISNHSSFLALAPQSRAAIFIADSLYALSINKFEAAVSIVDNLNNSFSRLKLSNDILYWMDAHNKSISEQEKEVCDKIKNYTKEQHILNCEKVLSSAINIYDESIFVKSNVWGLTHFYKQNDILEDRVKDYIRSCLNKENIFRFIWDFIGESYSNSIKPYGYKFDVRSLNYCGLEFNDIDKVLEQAEPKSDFEKFVVSLYLKAKEGDQEGFETSSRIYF